MKSKRGMSDVVTTLLIILLSIVAMAVVWAVIKNIISQGEEQVSLVGLTLDLEIQRASTSGGQLYVSVKRNPGEGNLVGINFVINDGSNSDVIRKSTTLQQLGSQNFNFFLSVLDVGEIQTISIAPIYLSSKGNEVIGEIVDTIDFGSGDLGTGGGAGSGSGDTNNDGIPDDDIDGDGIPNDEDDDIDGDGIPNDEDPDANGDGIPDGEGGAVCGNNLLETGEQCDDGDNVSGDGCSSACQIEGEECIPSCPQGALCGEDGCGGTCGTCDAGFTCGDDYLCYDESCQDEGPLLTCVNAEIECGVVYNNCGNVVNCDALFGGCSAGYTCEENFCVEVLPLNSGTIDNVWPPGIGIYFDSDELNRTHNLYSGRSVSFPQVDTSQCYFILDYIYDGDVYSNAIVGLNLLEPLAITSGNSYSIWQNSDDCQASLA